MVMSVFDRGGGWISRTVPLHQQEARDHAHCDHAHCES